MNTEKANIQNSMDATEIPEYVFESLARSLLPVIQKYYESEDGKKAFAEWKAKKEIASEEDSVSIVMKQDTSVVTDIAQANLIYMTTSIFSNEGSPIVLVFSPNKRADHQPWELQKAITETEFRSANYIELGSKPRDMLYNYAYWQNYNNDLKTLKNDLALPENWSYKENPADDDFPILNSYIKYTFAKLWKDKQVYVSESGQYSVFNTGLVNKNYQYIYAIFEKNVGSRPWRFLTFANPGVKYGGRILTGNFVSLPHPAHYFRSIDDVSYVITTDKTPDEQLPDLQPDHYFVDHPDRLPIDFLRDGCRKNADIVAMLNTDTNSMSGEEESVHWKKIGEAIGDDSEVYDDLEASFRNAVRKAIMRVSWNYRTAIPVYFPSYDKMSILLPLSFGTNSEAEVALVVERNAVSKKYTAPTILSLPIAYANARLVCKPESDWLNQKVLESVSSNITDDDE